VKEYLKLLKRNRWEVVLGLEFKFSSILGDGPLCQVRLLYLRGRDFWTCVAGFVVVRVKDSDEMLLNNPS
jgi:hypothetical protein